MRLWLAALVVLVAGCAGSEHVPAPAEASRPAIGAWGFDLRALDPSVDPGDDFFRYASGRWLRDTPIPADLPTWSSFNALHVQCEHDLRALLDELEANEPVAGSPGRKLLDAYRSYLDTDAIDRLGLAPAKDDLARIAALETHEEVAGLLERADLPANSPIEIYLDLDEKRPDAWILAIGQAGLGMPDRDYYLRTDSGFAGMREAYRGYVETLLELAGHADPAGAADAIAALEREIAEIHWPRARSRDRHLTYNPHSRRQLEALAPDFPWGEMLASFGAPAHDAFVVAQPDAVVALAKLFRATPVSTWRDYLAFHYLNAVADVLPTPFDRAQFDFYGRVISGTTEQRERWKRAIAAQSGSPFQAPLAETLGRLYVEKYFPERSKAAVRELVDDMRAAFAGRISRLAWMTPETRRAALRKLETMRLKIGHPDVWRAPDGLEIRAGEALGNRKRELAFARQRHLQRISTPADRGEWAMVPHRVNAYYSATWNEIVFPAAILQPPFFDPDADPAVNYGGIGAIIGHEIGHGFDDQGAKSDEFGILRTWWREEDTRRFEALTGRLAEQYSRYEVLPGLFVNGRLTLGENIGDIGGLDVALEAYRISLAGEQPPVLDGFTGTQRFFLGFAQIWRTLIREEALRAQIVSDPHSPAELRTNGSVRNLDEWYEAFDVEPEERLYLQPSARVRIW
jgi:predicted metalloendopeptidase